MCLLTLKISEGPLGKKSFGAASCSVVFSLRWMQHRVLTGFVYCRLRVRSAEHRVEERTMSLETAVSPKPSRSDAWAYFIKGA